MSFKCIVCYENFSDSSKGLSCGTHFLCCSCLDSYLTENVLPQVHQLRSNKCRVKCPCNDCAELLDTLEIFQRLSKLPKIRYALTIIGILSESVNSTAISFRNALLDMLTLKCPSCSVPIDPSPDACSAVMCLNCGNFYCNFCFTPFTGVAGRGEAHIHVASHSRSSVGSVGSDPFLPSSVVAEGQCFYRQEQIKKLLSLAMRSRNFTIDQHTDIVLAYLSCYVEFTDMNLDIIDIWSSVYATIASPSTSTNSSSEGTEMDDDTTDDLLSTLSLPTTVPSPHSTSSTAILARRGAIQLGNALISKNSLAIDQIMSSYKDTIDIHYTDTTHTTPLASLALLCDYPEIARTLIAMGASIYQTNAEGRSCLYITLEQGDLVTLNTIIDHNAHVDMSLPVTDEIQRYTPLHIAARYGLLFRPSNQYKLT